MSSLDVSVSPYLYERYKQIWEVVRVAGDQGATVTQVCDAVGLKKTPHIIALLDHMVASGWLRKEFVVGRYRHFRYWVIDG